MQLGNLKLEAATGASLLELLTSLLVLGVTVGIGVVSQGELMASVTFRNEVVSARTLLASAALRALQTESSIIVKLNDNYLVTESIAGATLRQVEVKSEAHIKSGGPPGQIVFSADGSATPGTLTLSTAGKSCKLIISLWARVRQECSSG